MAQQIINIGDPDKGNGDPLRTAFSKIKQNFAELYSHVSAGVVVDATAPTDPGEGDLWWDPESGRMYVYYGTSWVDASPVDGAGINSTNELVNGNKTVSLATTGILTLPSSSYLESTDINLKVGAQGTVTIRSNAASNLTTKSWVFNESGTINTPLMLPLTFTAVLDSAHKTGAALTLTGTPWEFTVQFQVNPNGTVETMLNSIFPNLVNPGYTTADQFAFTEADHGIPGYTFEIELDNLVLAGPAGWTASPVVSIPPEYPATVKSLGAIKLTADTQSLVFGTDGSLTLPTSGSLSTGSINFTGSLRVGSQSQYQFEELVTGEGEEAVYSSKLSLPNIAEIFAGDDISLSTWGSEFAVKVRNPSDFSDHTWTFGNDGGLKFPKTGNLTPTTEIYTTSGGDQYVLESYYAEGRGSGTYLKLDADSGIVTIQSGGPSKQWQFGADGSLTTPGTISAKATLALETIDLDTQYDQYLATVEILANEFLIADYTGQGYPASKDSYAALVRAKALNPLIPDAWLPMAMTLRNAYFTWAASSITLTVDGGGFVIANGGGISWRFDEATGLRFPDNTYQTTAFTGSATRLLSPNTNYNLTANNYGVQTNSPLKWMEGTTEQVLLNYVPDDDRFALVTNYSNIGNQRYWFFGDNGTLTFPSGAGFGLGETGQLKVNDGTTLSLDLRDSSGRGFYTNSDGFTLRSNGSNNWMFKSIGTLNLPNFGAVPGASDGAVGDICRNGDVLYFKTSSGWATIGLTL